MDAANRGQHGTHDFHRRGGRHHLADQTESQQDPNCAPTPCPDGITPNDEHAVEADKEKRKKKGNVILNRHALNHNNPQG